MAELFESNCGNNKIICGGLTCKFMGKEIPAFIGFSANASITSELLVDALRYLNDQNLSG